MNGTVLYLLSSLADFVTGNCCRSTAASVFNLRPTQGTAQEREMADEQACSI